jgi:hypothetical protein
VITWLTPSLPVKSCCSVATVAAFSAARVTYTIAVPPSGITQADPESPFCFSKALGRSDFL